MSICKKEKGFIAITSVLIIGALIVVLGVSMFYASLTDQSISSSYEDGQGASFLAEACVREGIIRLKDDIYFTGYGFSEGGEEIKIGEYICNVIKAENISSNTKRISSLAKSGEIVRFKSHQTDLRYSVESSAVHWSDNDELENLVISDDSLILDPELLEPSSGHRVSTNLDISGEGVIKNSQIFWQADTRKDNDIVIETNVHLDGLPQGWFEVQNGGSIPGLEKGIELTDVSIKTKATFNGGPDFYPRLDNINIFIEI
jgi:Tfp pilus assembly protein PilX